MVIVAGILIWRSFFRTPPVPENIVQLSGRIGGDDSTPSRRKPPDELLEIHVREGDQVKAGEVIAVLDDQQVKAREEQARSRSRCRASTRGFCQGADCHFQEQLTENQLQAEQSKKAMRKAESARAERQNLLPPEADLAVAGSLSPNPRILPDKGRTPPALQVRRGLRTARQTRRRSTADQAGGRGCGGQRSAWKPRGPL